jgi:hypothetical protein
MVEFIRKSIKKIEARQTCRSGDVFLIDSDPYLLCKVGIEKWGLISMEGNAWDYDFYCEKVLYVDAINEYIVKDMLRDTKVEYVGKCDIKVYEHKCFNCQ